MSGWEAPLALLLGAALWGHLETRRLRVIRTEFRSPSVPPEFEGYRIALLSGLHLRRIAGKEKRLQKILQEANPHVVLLAGNVKPTHNAENRRVHRLLEAFLHPLPAPDGVYAVRGYRDRKRFWDELPEGSRIELLSNSSAEIRRGSACLALVGIQTAHACHLDRGQNQLRETLARVPAGGFRILLGQSGDLLRIAQGHPIDLVLAGDNLHAQIRIPGIGILRRDTKVPLRWERGWIEEGGLRMHLSPGVGTRWLPFRVFLRPEVSIIEIFPSPSE